MKRVFTTIVMLALLCACMTPAAFAADTDLTYDLTVNGSNSVTAKTGDIITVTYTIHADEAYGVNAIQNEIKFDESFFEFVEDSATAEVGVAHLVQKIAGPRVYMNNTSARYAAEQRVGTFRLKVIGTSGSGVVESTECLAYDDSGNALTITSQDLTVTIGSSSSSSSSGSSSVPTGIQVTVTPKDNDTYTVKVTEGRNTTPVTKLDEPVTVSIPKVDGNVVLATYSDGTELLLGKSLVESGTAYFLLNGSATVEIIDNSKSFADVADSAWYKGAVDFVSSHELFNGVGAAKFAPDVEMSRAMLVTVLYRLESEPEVTAANSFADVGENTWYTDAVIWADANGIVEGYGNGLFGPEDYVTREQMATILYRYMSYLGLDVSKRDSLSAFPDGGQVSAWAKEATQWAVGSGIITGKGGGSDLLLDPTGDGSRAEVATMLMRLVTLMVK